MPIYEYKCPQCNDIFEEWVSSYADTAPCPKCSTSAKQIISNTSFVLKGGGWYVTDHGSRKNQENNCDSEEAPASSPNCANAKQNISDATTSENPKQENIAKEKNTEKTKKVEPSAESKSVPKCTETSATANKVAANNSVQNETKKAI